MSLERGRAASASDGQMQHDASCRNESLAVALMVTRRMGTATSSAGDGRSWHSIFDAGLRTLSTAAAAAAAAATADMAAAMTMLGTPATRLGSAHG